MSTFIKYTFAVVLFSISITCMGKEPMSPKSTAESFLSDLKSGDVAEAYESLAQGAYLKKDNAKAFEGLINQTKTALPRLGLILGHELVAEKSFGESVVRLAYLLKSEKQPSVWIFHFYRPAETWFLVSVNFGDQLSVLETFH